jgi:phosphonoacetaldehyde hydrolase
VNSKQTQIAPSIKSLPPLRAVILDWAGTTVDHGSVAPVLALQSLFLRHDIALSSENARKDMGLLKLDHIRSILALPNIRTEWHEKTGRFPGEAEVVSLFGEFGILQLEIVAQHSQVIAGVADTVQHWQQRGLRIGSTTGYTREMLDPVLIQARKDGYCPDASVCPDEVGAGRPLPWMLARNVQLLDVYPPSSCVKIGDTVSDIEEGRNAGMWTIGLTRTGNLVGLDADAWTALPEDQKSERIRCAEEQLLGAGADFVAEDLPACDPILDLIDEQLQAMT